MIFLDSVTKKIYLSCAYVLLEVLSEKIYCTLATILDNTLGIKIMCISECWNVNLIPLPFLGLAEAGVSRVEEFRGEQTAFSGRVVAWQTIEET